jgi:predicted AlkP superfamily phosphohydrolase/phosphomutase
MVQSKSNNNQPRVLIIGLDGATFDLIEPWVKTGKLPHFSRLMQDGIYGDLTSTIPPVTPPAWTSFMTGKNPGRHGLFDFLEPKAGSYEMQYTNGRFRKCRTIWKTLSEENLSVGVVNLPMTYPPEEVNGFLISGMDTPDESAEFMYPSSLKQELINEMGGLSLDIRHLGYMRTDEIRDETIEALERLEEQRTRAALYLLERYPTDVFMLVFNATDQVQHHFWHYLDPSHPQYDAEGAKKYGDVILRIYEKIDDCMGRLLEKIGQDIPVILVSDHGGGPVGHHYLYLNRYLAQLGVLNPVKNSNGFLNLSDWFSRFINRTDRFLRGKLTPDQKLKAAKLFPKLRERVESYLSLGEIDWSATRAYAFESASTSPNIWINLKTTRPNGTVQPGREYEELVEFVRGKLLELSDPQTGKRLIRKVYRKHEIYNGPYLDHAPDLILDWWSDTHFVVRQSFPCKEGAPVVVPRKGKLSGGVEWSGTHRINGIALFKGTPFIKGQRLKDVSIMDMAPTILYLLGVPIPEDMEGRVLEEVFEAVFLGTHSIAYQKQSEAEAQPEDQGGSYTEEEAEKIKERLTGLGYLE